MMSFRPSLVSVFALFISLGFVVDAMANQACPADVAPQPLGDGVVNNLDLMAIINAWETDDCRYDIAPPGGDGIVNNSDMELVVSSWGNCPTAEVGACWVNNACSQLSRSACEAAGGLAWEPVACTDSDGDLIPSVFERNDCKSPCGVYVGTNPEVKDTDEDGLSDGLEVFGLLAGGGTINLPELGANPLRKSIFLEIDWMEHTSAHRHKPTAQSIEDLQDAFANSPVVNPCHASGTGIDLIVDFGQGGLFTGGNQITNCPNSDCSGITWDDFQDLKVEHFSPARLGVFYYSIHVHTNLNDPGSSGVGEINGDDHMVNLPQPTTQSISRTIMHELGHNLGLYHGGGDYDNYKPNYPSIMNYKYASGVDTNCDAVGDGVLDYSRGLLSELDENNLLETVGMCGTPIDWNRDFVIQEFAYPYNVTCGFECEDEDCPYATDECTILADHDDWGNLSLSDILGPGGGHLTPPQTITCELP